MKFVKGISLFFLYPCMTFFAGIYLGAEAERYFYPSRPDLLITEAKPEDFTGTEGFSETEETAWQAAAEEEEVLTSDTEYVVEEYDTRRGTAVETVLKVPDKYLGMDRDSFEEAMELYALSPPLSERERGFVGLEVRSFSRSRVVVRMNYLYVEPTRGFYLKVEDNNIVVYCDDKQTVYMYTTISALKLPQAQQSQIVNGIYMEDEEALYSFLETYSS